MAKFTISSMVEFHLKNIDLYLDDITINKVTLVDSTDIQNLFRPIQIITHLPNGIKTTDPLYPTSYFSNTRKEEKIATDIPINYKISNCIYTKIRIDNPKNEIYKLEIEYTRSPRFISDIRLENFWGKYNLDWSLHDDVNILVGINGSGKTTLLNMIEEVFNGKNTLINKTKSHLFIAFSGNINIQAHSGNGKNTLLIDNFKKISTFDVPITDKRSIGKETTQLDTILFELIYGGKGETLSLLKLSDLLQKQEIELLRKYKNDEAEAEAEKIRGKIPRLFNLINDFFKDTYKVIKKRNNGKFYFELNNEAIELKELSAGEKQLLILLISVFLQQEEPFILMMDEPEISLHIRWQQKLISTIRELNPNCQLIIATHSPSIFGNGYGEKLFWIEKLWNNNNG